MSEPARLIPAAASARAEPAGRLPFAFGPRCFVLLLAGMIWLGPVWWDFRFLWALAAWDVLVLLAWAWDLQRLPNPRQLEVRRIWNAPAGLSTAGTIALEVVNDGSLGILATAVDDVPPALRAEVPRVVIAAAGGTAGQAEYSIQPVQRGDAKFGRVWLRYQSVFRIGERWATADLRQQVRVYPNLGESKRQALYLMRSRQLDMERRRRRQRGLGREFEGLREYQPGDELRDVCWTATARRTKLITRVYQAERSQTVWMVLDAGRLLRARVAGLTKLDYAVNAAFTLAQVASQAGDRVGLLAYGRGIQQRLGPGRGTAHLRQMVEQLALVRSEALEANHPRALQALMQQQKRRSLVVWLTDLAEIAITPEVIEGALAASTRHLVLFLVIGEPELPHLVSRRPEKAEEMYRYVAAQQTMQRRELLLRGLRQRGTLAMEVMPGRLSTTLLNQYLEIKERGRL